MEVVELVRYILLDKIVKCPKDSTTQDIEDCRGCKMLKKEHMNHIECYYEDT